MIKCNLLIHSHFTPPARSLIIFFLEIGKFFLFVSLILRQVYGFKLAARLGDIFDDLVFVVGAVRVSFLFILYPFFFHNNLVDFPDLDLISAVLGRMQIQN